MGEPAKIYACGECGAAWPAMAFGCEPGWRAERFFVGGHSTQLRQKTLSIHWIEQPMASMFTVLAYLVSQTGALDRTTDAQGPLRVMPGTHRKSGPSLKLFISFLAVGTCRFHKDRSMQIYRYPCFQRLKVPAAFSVGRVL